MKVDDAWILSNDQAITHDVAKLFLAVFQKGKLILRPETVEFLKRRAGMPTASTPDWAERAAGDHTKDG